MKSFEYATPATVNEVVSLLSPSAEETAVLAGGTDLVTSMKQMLTSPKQVVSLRRVEEIKGIDTSGGKVRIGAMTSLTELMEHDAVQRLYPAIVGACEGIGAPQMLHMGTVGGELCQRPRCWYYRQGFGLFGQHDGKSLVIEGDNRYHAIFGNEGPAYFVHPSSLAPAFIALDAVFTAEGPDGKRDIPAGEFFKIPKSETEREHVLEPNELLTHITLPGTQVYNATYEVRHRNGLDWPYVTASVCGSVEGDRAANVKVVLGHVAPVPWPSKAAADALEGKQVDAEAAKAAGEAAAKGAKPLSRNQYKVAMVKTAVKRAVEKAAGIGS